jgi:hypothetical protein
LGRFGRLLKNGASRGDPALCGFCKCSHINAYAALFKMPHTWADGLMLVFQHPIRRDWDTIMELERRCEYEKSYCSSVRYSACSRVHAAQRLKTLSTKAHVSNEQERNKRPLKIRIFIWNEDVGASIRRITENPLLR